MSYSPCASGASHVHREGPPPHNPCAQCRGELPSAPEIELQYGRQRLRFCRLVCLLAWCEVPTVPPPSTGKGTK